MKSAKPLRILFVSEYFYPRQAGGEVWSWELCTELARRGHKVTVLTTNHGDLKTEDEKDGVTILRLADNAASANQRLLRNASMRRFVKKVSEYLKDHKNDIDVVHVMAYTANVKVSKAAATHKLPCITSVHSYFGNDWDKISPYGFLLKRFERTALEHDKSSIIQVPSKRMKESIEGGIKEKKDIIVIHNWAPDRFPKPKRLPKDTLLYVGSLEKIKIRDVKEFVGAAKALDAPLIIIGKGSLESDIRKEAKRAKLGPERFRILSGLSREETLSYIGGAGMVLVPSVSESFSLVALEAVAQGTPVSGNPVGILPELPSVTRFPPRRVPERVSAAKALKVRREYDRKALVDKFVSVYVSIRKVDA